MKIGVILSMHKGKGIERFIYNDLKLLEARGVSFILFPLRVGRGLYNPARHWDMFSCSVASVILRQPLEFLKQPLTYSRLLFEAIRFKAIPEFLFAFAFMGKMKEVDLIHATFGGRKFYVGYFCKKVLKTPLVATIHAYELYANENFSMFRKALQFCDGIVTVTEYNKEYLIENFGVPADKIQVIRIIVDLDDYKYEEKFKILIVGYFVEKKGHEILFRAIKELNNPKLEVWVVGDVERSGNGGVSQRSVDLKKLVNQLGIGSQLVFFGALKGNALKAVYRECDLFCLPSRTASDGDREGFPVVLAEAMAFSKPIVTTNHVEIPRLIKEIIVEENSVEELAKAIDQAYRDKTFRRETGKDNRKTAERFFSYRNTDELIKTFGAQIRVSQN